MYYFVCNYKKSNNCGGCESCMQGSCQVALYHLCLPRKGSAGLFCNLQTVSNRQLWRNNRCQTPNPYYVSADSGRSTLLPLLSNRRTKSVWPHHTPVNNRYFVKTLTADIARYLLVVCCQISDSYFPCREWIANYCKFIIGTYSFPCSQTLYTNHLLWK